MLLIRTVVRAEGVTAIVATHDPVMIEVADRVIELLDGSLIEPTHLAARRGRAARLTPAGQRAAAFARNGGMCDTSPAHE